MDEKKITKFAFGCGILLLFFRFFYTFEDASVRETVLLALSALTVVSDGTPALIRFGRKKKFGRREAFFTMLYLLEIAGFVCVVTSGISAPAVIFLLAAALVLIVWQSLILNPPKKGEKQS